MGTYFDLEKPQAIENIAELFSLNIEKSYYAPGSEEPVDDAFSFYAFPEKTSGVFRGQMLDWELKPKSYRDTEPEENADELSKWQLDIRYRRANHDFRKFCELAEKQNPSFPSSVSRRMGIAQHYGVDTPLLDWSENIFTAIYFAIRRVLSDEAFEEESGEANSEEAPKVYIYHVVDERHFCNGIPEEDELTTFGKSALIEPTHIDRRIERQRGVFSYHPHPVLEPASIPAKVYTVEWNLIDKLLDMMKGFGFTEDYFFPDYAGIARSVKSDITL